MTGPPATGPAQADPGGFQAGADGQQVEVRTYEGELIRVVPASVADALVQAQVADNLKHSVRLKLGVRWLPPRFDRPTGRPDLDQMRRRDPGRVSAGIKQQQFRRFCSSEAAHWRGRGTHST